jgi:hypothetical protein
MPIFARGVVLLDLTGIGAGCDFNNRRKGGEGEGDDFEFRLETAQSGHSQWLKSAFAELKSRVREGFR